MVHAAQLRLTASRVYRRSVHRDVPPTARMPCAHRTPPFRHCSSPTRVRVSAGGGDQTHVKTAAAPAVVLVGFDDAEGNDVSDIVAALEREHGATTEVVIVRVQGTALARSMEHLMGENVDATATEAHSDPPTTAHDDATVPAASVALALPPGARCVLLRGEAARALLPDLKIEMVESGIAPAVFGVFTPAHAGASVGTVVTSMLAAHERCAYFFVFFVYSSECPREKPTCTRDPGTSHHTHTVVRPMRCVDFGNSRGARIPRRMRRTQTSTPCRGGRHSAMANHRHRPRHRQWGGIKAK